MNKKLLIYGIVCVLFFTCSCGYKFSNKGHLPENVTKVFVEIFENKSFETGAEIFFTSALINELIKNTNIEIVKQKNAKAVIKGTIRSITIDALSRESDDSVIERDISAVVDIKIIKKSKKVIWSIQELSDHEKYIVSDKNLIAKANDRKVINEAMEKQIIRKIAKRISEKVVKAITDNF